MTRAASAADAIRHDHFANRRSAKHSQTRRLCDVVRSCAILFMIKRREFIASRGGGLVCGALPKFNGFVLRRGGPCGRPDMQEVLIYQWFFASPSRQPTL